MNKQIINKVSPLIKQFIKFGFVGAINTGISLVVYYILVIFDVHPVLANTAGFIASVINSFILNKKFVFKNRTETSEKRAFIKVFISYGISFMISVLLIELFVDVLHISKYLAPLLRLSLTIPFNFLMNKLWAFKDKYEGGNGDETKGF